LFRKFGANHTGNFLITLLRQAQLLIISVQR